MRKSIAVIGGDCKIKPKVKDIADKIGEDIAKSGCVLICGGRGGVMEAACRGAKRAGGTTVGILPSNKKSEANKYVDIALPTGMGYARNTLVVNTADVVIAIDGGVGTLSEMAFALNYCKPVVCVKDSGGVADSVPKEIDEHGTKLRIHYVEAKHAVKTALKLIKTNRR